MIETIRPFVALALFILVWLVQLIIYPSLVHIQESSFLNWHARYMNLISIFVMPLMLAELAMISMLVYTKPNVNHIISVVLLLVIWISTFLRAVPLHNTLASNGYDMIQIQQLVKVNWIRTIGWTLLLVLALIEFPPFMSAKA